MSKKNKSFGIYDNGIPIIPGYDTTQKATDQINIKGGEQDDRRS